MARPRLSITYEEKVETGKKRRVVDGEGGASAGPVPEEKEEKGKGWAPGAALPCELGLATGGAADNFVNEDYVRVGSSAISIVYRRDVG